MNSEHRFVALMSRDEDIRRQHYEDLKIARNKGIEAGRLEGMQEGIEYNVPINVDTVRRREPIKWTYLEGIQEGENNGKREIILKLYKNKLSIDDIARFTVLPIENVQSILGLS